MTRTSRSTLVLGAILAAAAIVRLAFLREIAGTAWATVPLLDAQTYHDWALRLVAGDPGWDETYWMGPLYPHLLALVYRLFGPGGLAPQALQLGLTLANVWLVHRLALSLLRRGGARDAAAERTALVAAALYAFYGPPVFYAGMLLMATVATTLMLVTAMLALRADRQPSVRNWFLLGLIVGVGGLARGNVLLLVATLPLLLRGQDLRRGERWRRVLVLAAGAILVVAPVTIRNVVVARDFTLLTSNGGVNLLIGQQADGDGTFTILLETPDAEYDPSLELNLEAELGRDLKGSEVSRLLAARAWRTFRDDLGRMPRHYAMKIWRFWSGYELPQIDAYIWWSHRFAALAALPVPYTLISALGLLGFTVLPRRPRLLLLILVLTTFVSLLPFFPTSRYRQPIAPLLCVPAAAWICAMVGSRCGWSSGPAGRRRLVHGAAAAGLVALLWPSWTALPARNVAWQVHMHEASRASRQGDLRGALLAGQEGEAAWPGRAETPFLLATCLEDLKAWDAARAAIAQAAARAPNNRLVQYRVGRIAEQSGHADEALAAYERAAQLSPQWAYPWLRAGLVLHGQGRLEEALAALREAVGRSPGNRRIRANLGSALAETGRTDEARSVLTDLTRDYPTYVNGWFNLALVEYRAGDHAAAAAAIGRAAKLHGLTAAERAQVERLTALIRDDR